MEIDIEIQLVDVPRVIASELANRFIVEFKEAEQSDHHGLLIRAAKKPWTSSEVDPSIRKFLRSLGEHSETIKKSRGILRLGIFYNLSESVVFPLRLSYEAVREIGNLNLSLDATGYPCTEDDED